MEKSKYKIGNPIRYKTFMPTDVAISGAVDKSFGTSLKTIFETKQGVNAENVHRFPGTSESVDRDGEVVLASAWDMKNYEKNPVALWSHDRRALPIGKTVGIYLDEATKVMYFDIELSAGHSFSRDVKALVEEGIIRATSVGFMVKDWEWNDAAEAAIFTDVELFEISLCNVPANQDAVADAPKAIEDENEKSAEIEAFSAQVAQLMQAVGALSSKLDSVLPKEEPEPEPTVVEPEVTTEPEVPPVTPVETPELSQEMLDSITEAVLLRINQPKEVTPTPTETSPSDIPEDDAGVTTPAPEPGEEEELVHVGVGDLDETESFVVVNEEEI